MPIVVARLYGGLGNQLFQYAAGRRVASAQGAVLKLDLGWFSDGANRRYALAPFAISASVATSRDLALFVGQGVSARLRRRWLEIRRGTRPRRIRPRDERFDPTIMALRGDVYLDGYWQSEKYFADIEDLIRRELSVTTPLAGEDARVAGAILASPAVSVHVRRGDYASEPETAAVHGTCPAEYYEAASSLVMEAVPQPHFFVFSDEAAWARANLRLPGPATFVAHNGADAGHEDLRLMSLCRHHIIANSSFSWWGAWLSDNPGKMVIAPARWFRSPGYDSRDIVPAEWRCV
jgi:hypothetical protein